MIARDVLRKLKDMGTAQNRKVYARHGVGESQYGVSYANLRALGRKIKTDHGLAKDLWETGNHDARILATIVADPEALGARDLDTWSRELDNYVVTDAFAALAERLKYTLARTLYGRYPPRNGLNYIWANRAEETGRVASPYTDQAVLIPLQQGPERAGQWVVEEVNVLADYRQAFGEEPPAEASLAVMSDGDNTGEGTSAYIDFIEVGK